MTLPISIAEKLQQLLQPEASLPASALKHAVVETMINDGVLQKRISGKSKAVIFISDPAALRSYLNNHFGIANLEQYIVAYKDADITRSEAIAVSGNSKLKTIRTFKGFLVNSYEPISAMIDGKQFIINPPLGTLTFISDYEAFIPDPGVTIVGMENPENFRKVQRQRYLFEGGKVLFISRYPQSNDGIKWLQTITNDYLHFGDLDFSGINIYLNEYKKWLGKRASFFVPSNTAGLLHVHGNRELYNRQLSLAPDSILIEEENVRRLISLLHQHKMVLEQEAFIL
ncbi:MAG: hypothetical protein ABIX01_05900 [Chitinophagaceae bacterium]